MESTLDRIRERRRIRSEALEGTRFPRLTTEQWNALEVWLESKAPSTPLDPRRQPDDRKRLIHDTRAHFAGEIMKQRPKTEEVTSGTVVVAVP